MPIETLETIKQQVLLLSSQEQAELARFLTEQQEKDRHQAAPAPSAETAAAEMRRQQHLEWMKSHRQEYGGLYVALDGERLVATGKNFPEAARAAQAAGVPQAFVTFVHPPDYVGEMGGWA